MCGAKTKFVEGKHPQIALESKLYSEKIFYIAEDYHKNYFNDNRQQPYCQIVIEPKFAKFKAKYSSLLKK